MNTRMQATILIGAFALASGLAACGNEAQTGPDNGGVEKPPLEKATRSPGKPSAPVDIRYRVLGTPVVGQPVSIEVELATPRDGQSLTVSYAINDPDSLVFADTQPQSIELTVPDGERSAVRQVTVVPQREGRLYLNVTAEIRSDDGSMLKSMSIPLVVGVDASEPEVNGTLVEDADGDPVVSMPAREN